MKKRVSPSSKPMPKAIKKNLKDLSPQDMKELLLLQAYKMALLRGQVEALTDIIVRHKLATREEVWKLTEENFEDSAP
jgi:hypothetical protein